MFRASQAGETRPLFFGKCSPSTVMQVAEMSFAKANSCSSRKASPSNLTKAPTELLRAHTPTCMQVGFFCGCLHCAAHDFFRTCFARRRGLDPRFHDGCAPSPCTAGRCVLKPAYAPVIAGFSGSSLAGPASFLLDATRRICRRRIRQHPMGRSGSSRTGRARRSHLAHGAAGRRGAAIPRRLRRPGRGRHPRRLLACARTS